MSSLGHLPQLQLADIGGLAGVLLMLSAYGLGQLGRLRMDTVPALLMNLAGASLVLLSLLFRFNLSAFVVESAWALLSLFGLLKLALKKRG